jgi:hypothetical protein
MKLRSIALAAIAAISFCAQAAVVRPSDLVIPDGGTLGYSWDLDKPAPVGSATVGGATGFGNSSWYANVVPEPGKPDYTAFRIFTDKIFGVPVTLGELDNISYWSKWVDGQVDWQVKIYTVKTGANWYDSRTNYNTGTAKGGVWTLWNTDSLGVNWLLDTDTTNDHTNEKIMFVDIIAGYANPGATSQTYLDGVTIRLVGGRSHVMDLEANVPEPGSLVVDDNYLGRSATIIVAGGSEERT